MHIITAYTTKLLIAGKQGTAYAFIYMSLDARVLDLK